MLLSIFIRTIIIYVILTITMRIMGKRQLGELDVSELVITILLSEIATLPITNTEEPISHALIPIALLAGLEILSSALILKLPLAKNILSSKPAVIIAHGTIDIKEMKRVRISIEDLMSQIRQNGIYNIEEVDYAILEENGKMSIIPKSRYRQPDREDLNIASQDDGIMHIIISNGVVNSHGLSIVKKDRKWLKSELSRYGLQPSEVFCMTCDDVGQLYVIKNDGSAPKPQK